MDNRLPVRELPDSTPPRTVRPRSSSFKWRPIVALADSEILMEDGSRYHAEALPIILYSLPSSILVCQGFAQPLQRVQRVYGEEAPNPDPEFNYRVTPIYRYLPVREDGYKRARAQSVDTVCNFIGWRHEVGKTRSGKPKFETRYHHPLDPTHFLAYLNSINDIDDSNRPTLERLQRWGIQVREWCKCNNLQIKASAGGLAAQLLRDSRFYPEPRRKAPRLINDVARSRLPGNYYRLHAPTDKPCRAVYLDMSAAHHHMAARIRFPDVNTLHGYGDFSFAAREEIGKTRPRPFAPGDSPLLERPGLFHVRLSVPGIPPKRFPPPFLETPGEVDCWLYSNELSELEPFGTKVLRVYAAYSSEKPESGLNRYAKFALRELTANPDMKPWLKPTLHATYGLLAARAVPFETGYYRAKGGPRTEYLMGRYSLHVHSTKRERPVESKIVNVIHRGMIEAEVRKEALWFARWLSEVDKREVLAIYADSVFIRDTDRPMGILQPPWRVAAHLRNLRFHSAVHFTSDRLSRLPGVPRNLRESYVRQRELAKYLRETRGRVAA